MRRIERNGGRAIGGRLRIVEVVLPDGGGGPLLCHALGHDGAGGLRLGEIPFGIAHVGRILARIGARRSLARVRRRTRRPHARTARIGVEARIAVKDEIVFIVACGVGVKEDGTAALVGVLCGERRLHLGLCLLGIAAVGSGHGCRCDVRPGIGGRLIAGRTVARRNRHIGRRGCLRGRCRGLLPRGCTGRLGQIVKRDALLPAPLFGALARRGKNERAQGGIQRDEIEREHNEQCVENVCAHARENGADGIGDEPEQDAAARAAGDPLPRRRPAGVHIAAEPKRKVGLRRRRLHNEKDRGEQEVHAGDPACRNGLLSEDEHEREIEQQHKKRVDEKSRKSHKKCRDRYADLTEDRAARDADKQHDGAEQEQRHADRLPRQECAHIFILFVFSATDSVQNNLRPAPSGGAVIVFLPARCARMGTPAL